MIAANGIDAAEALDAGLRAGDLSRARFAAYEAAASDIEEMRGDVNVQGTVTANGFTVPLNVNYCVTGIAAGSCTSGNSSRWAVKKASRLPAARSIVATT